MTILLSDVGPKGLERLLHLSWKKEAATFAGGAPRRKWNFHTRLLIDHELYEPLINARINKVYESAQSRRDIKLFVQLRRNILKRTADRVAVVYDRPPLRTLRKVAETKRRDFLRVYAQAKTATKATTWGRNAWMVNVVHVLPRWESEGLRWVTVLPHKADVIFDPRGEDKPSILVYETTSMGAAFVAVDHQQWWWLTKDWQLIASEVHGLGRRPWAEFRVAEPPGDDYWDRGRRQSIADSTVELGRIEAHKGWARKGQSKKAPYMFVGQEDKVPANQTLNGEDLLYARTDTATIGVLDTVLSVEEFVAEIDDIIDDVAQSEGVPPSVVDWRASDVDRAVEHAALVKVRTKQTKHLRVGELELAMLTGQLLLQVGHPAGLPAAAIEREFRIEYAQLTFADLPGQRVDTAKALMGLGGTTPYQFFQQEHPELTAEAARTEVDQNLEEIAEFWEFYSSRNLPADAATQIQTSIQSLPQAQGAVGGPAAAPSGPPANTTPDREHEDEATP